MSVKAAAAIVTELWRFAGAKTEPRGSKSLRVLQGKPTDVLSWMRQCRDQKLNRKLENA
ncbi:hypothetical protein BH10PSE11_BH10PSE11_13680 [soil metagenome]